MLFRAYAIALFLTLLFVLQTRAKLESDSFRVSRALLQDKNTYGWGCDDWDPKTNHSIAAYIWCKSLTEVEASYATQFIQKIKSGLLSPRAYGGFETQDGWWLNRGRRTYAAVCRVHSCPDDLKRFFALLSWEYGKYAWSTVKPYGVPDPSEIVDNQKAAAYADYESKYSKKEEPIYSVAMSYACLFLWPMLAQRLAYEGADVQTNAYKFWIDENLSVGSTAKFAQQLLDEAWTSIDKNKALKIFQGALKHEAEFFDSTKSYGATIVLPIT